MTLRVRFEFVNPCGNDARAVQDFVNDLHRSLVSSRGTAYAVRQPGFVLIEATVPSVGFLEERLHVLAEAFIRHGRNCSYTIISNVPDPLSKTEIDRIEGLRAEPVSLTRRFFFSRATGEFLASNIGRSLLNPEFGETIAGPESRDAQWRRVVDLKVAQTKCRVFPSEAAFRVWAAD
jgi:hypothetical protein